MNEGKRRCVHTSGDSVCRYFPSHLARQPPSGPFLAGLAVAALCPACSSGMQVELSPASSLKPLRQEHSYPPSVLVQTCNSECRIPIKRSPSCQLPPAPACLPGGTSCRRRQRRHCPRQGTRPRRRKRRSLPVPCTSLRQTFRWMDQKVVNE